MIDVHETEEVFYIGKSHGQKCWCVVGMNRWTTQLWKSKEDESWNQECLVLSFAFLRKVPILSRVAQKTKCDQMLL